MNDLIAKRQELLTRRDELLNHFRELTKLTQIMIDASKQPNLEIEYGLVRMGDILHSFGDIRKAKELLNYEAAFDAVSGFKTYLDYYQKKFYPHNL